jgi:hypothetical protein
MICWLGDKNCRHNFGGEQPFERRRRRWEVDGTGSCSVARRQLVWGLVTVLIREKEKR